jgi:hypothetical protein
VVDSIWIQDADGSLKEATNAPYDLESKLQELLAHNEQLLPGAQIDPDNPKRFLLVKREAGVPRREGGSDRWSVDLLFVDQDAVPTLVEIKRSANLEARRRVVAQMLEYAANGSRFWSTQTIREWLREGKSVSVVGESDDSPWRRLPAWLGREDEEPEDVAEEFLNRTVENLRDGQLRLVFVADDVPESLRVLVEFLNEQMPRIDVLAVEIRRYQVGDSGLGAFVPRLIGRTTRAVSAKELTQGPSLRSHPWTIEEVRDALSPSNSQDANALYQIDQWAQSRQYLVAGGRNPDIPTLKVRVDIGQIKPRTIVELTAVGGELNLEVRLRDRLFVQNPYKGVGRRTEILKELREAGITGLPDHYVLGMEPQNPRFVAGVVTVAQLGSIVGVLDRWIADVRSANHDKKEPVS